MSQLPLGVLHHQVFQFLRTHRDRYTITQLEAAVHHPLHEYPGLLDLLQQHANITYDGTGYAYRPTLGDLRDKRDLFEIIQMTPMGISESEVKDVYPGALQDLERLVAEKSVIRLVNSERKCTRYYPRGRQKNIHVDDDIKRLWFQVKLPPHYSEQKELLRRAGFEEEDAMHHKAREVLLHERPKGPKRPVKKRAVIKTNTHLLDQEWLTDPNL
jgi:hypothetical protein